jgi:Zn-dependent M28 family amino/carboxypeptidase
LQQRVNDLASRPRIPGSAAHIQAAAYASQYLERAGLIVHAEPFQERGRFGVNIMTKPVPEDSKLPLLIVGAHYDTVPLSPGADDNASGVAVMLELAMSLRSFLRANLRFRCRLQFVAYDLEEADDQGVSLRGSAYHSRVLRSERAAVAGMMSLEMVGYTDRREGSQRWPKGVPFVDPVRGDFIATVANDASEPFARNVANVLRTIDGLPVESIVVPGKGERIPDSRRSDHGPFWDSGYPAFMLTDTANFRNPHYHRESDTPKTLDYVFMPKVTLGLHEALKRLMLGE